MGLEEKSQGPNGFYRMEKQRSSWTSDTVRLLMSIQAVVTVEVKGQNRAAGTDVAKPSASTISKRAHRKLETPKSD